MLWSCRCGRTRGAVDMRGRPGSVRSLEELGRVRLSASFFMRDFLHSEIADFHGILNIPDAPDLAIAAGRKLCERCSNPCRRPSAGWHSVLPTARVLDLPVDNATDLLAGQALADEGIIGAVEADFFDWPLKHSGGEELIRDVAQQTERFRLRDVEADVPKILYESLIDPEQRHDLGEYYTTDWLAGRIVTATIDNPLKLRVLDPACGSGTFLFHAIRHLIAAGRASEMVR